MTMIDKPALIVERVGSLVKSNQTGTAEAGLDMTGQSKTTNRIARACSIHLGYNRGLLAAVALVSGLWPKIGNRGWPHWAGVTY